MRSSCMLEFRPCQDNVLLRRKLSCSRIYGRTCLQSFKGPEGPGRFVYGSWKVGIFAFERRWRAGRFAAGSSLRRAFPPLAASAAVGQSRGICRTHPQRLGQRSAVRARPPASDRPGHRLFAAHARNGAGNSARCSGSLPRTCGTLLHEPYSISSCRHNR